MSDLWKGIFTRGVTSKSLAFMCAGLLFGASAPAFAAPCSTEASPRWQAGKSPPADVQRAVTDTMYGYAWTIDERDAVSFSELFIPKDLSYYELCNTDGQVFKLLFKNKTIETEIGKIVTDLADNEFQTRHLVTNILFEEVDADTVKTKAIVLVTLQAGNLDRPELDYTADARATLKKADGGQWKFESLTIHADIALVSIKKR